MKRRTWLLSAVGAAGTLVVGWSVVPPASRVGSASLMPPTEGDVALNGWIKIRKDGHVVLAMPRSEMGQGVHAGLMMLAADELDTPMEHIHLEQAAHEKLYGNVAMLVSSLPFHPLESEGAEKPFKIEAGEWMVGKIAGALGINATGGSSSLADGWEPVRQAAAAVRSALMMAASMQWKMPLSELTLETGRVVHRGGRSAHFGLLAAFAAGVPLGPVTPKPPAAWSRIGKTTARPDIPSKVFGTAQFGIDVRQEGMLFAAVRMCPMLGGTVAKLDSAKALTMPGVQRVVELPADGGSTAGFAVVARNTWQARQALDAVEVQWAQRSAGALDSSRIEAALWERLEHDEGFAFYSHGDIAKTEAGAAKVVEARYSAPYLAHATMEPMNCTARYAKGALEVWAPTQVPGFARDIAARATGLAPEKVQLHVTLLGGGFGRRLDVDFVAQAARVARACEGTAVQLLWSREEDTTHDFYRPMHVAKLRSVVDAGGQVKSLRIQSAGDAITPRWMERGLPALAGPVDTPDKTTAEGLFDLPYGFEHQHMAHVATRSGVPVGFWRSVGHSHNAFFSESFIDELAAQTGRDPLEFRRALLQKAPRYLAVLNLAADKAGWGQPLPAGRKRGIALHESFGSIVAEVVEVSEQDGRPRVHRVVCAIDCGTVVNPGAVAQQMESSVVYALTAALYGRIDIRDGVVQQDNFPRYPLVTLAQTPLVETWTIASTRPPAGVGEPGVPPLAPAVGNAWFALTGKRLRSLPLTT